MIRKLLLSFVFLLLLLVYSPGISYAAEYQITEQELTRLEQIFQTLENNNNKQAEQLERASNLLQKSEKQILLLNEKLMLAEQSIAQAQNSLEKANKSFKEYEKEVKRETNKLKLQRDICLAGLIYVLAKE